jgi:hypothetical protein
MKHLNRILSIVIITALTFNCLAEPVHSCMLAPAGTSESKIPAELKDGLQDTEVHVRSTSADDPNGDRPGKQGYGNTFIGQIEEPGGNRNSRLNNMPKMPGRNEGDQRHRGPSDHQEDSATSWDLGDQKP